MRIADFLLENTVHIWTVRLDDENWDKYAGLLSDDEHAKAHQFQEVQQRSGFRRCRTALRMLLGRYSGHTADSLVFDYGNFGKPELVLKEGVATVTHDEKTSLHFNLSHTGISAAIAVSRYPVGVDLEVIGERDVDALSAIVCHPKERAELTYLRGMAKSVRFLQLWTRKEACLKAVGTGVRSDLRDLSFIPLSGKASRVVSTEVISANDYYVHDLSFAGGFIGCVSTTLASPRIEMFRFEA